MSTATGKGRPVGDIFSHLKFCLIKEGRSYSALCKICSKVLKNTSQIRLRAHRNICHDPEMVSNVDGNDIEFVEVNEMQISQDGSLVPVTSESWETNDGENILSHPDLEESVPGPSTPKRRRQNTLIKFMDKLKDEELEILNEKLTQFIVACNIPFHIVESDFFKDFVKTLRPAYYSKIPCRKTLSTTLLDKLYEKCLIGSRSIISAESVLLIDGWKNSSSNSKLIVTMIHNSDGTQAFLEAFDSTGESETAEKLCEIVSQAMTIAKSTFKSDIYAIVSDNASAMVKMGTLMQHKVWHSTCNSHTANLLAKDILNKQLTENVSMILKEFKQSDFEKMLVDKGGSRIKLPCETRWCSYRDSYKCLLNNLSYMKIIAAETTKKLKLQVSHLLFNEDFISQVKECLEYFDPVCTLINTCQSAETSIADAADMWLHLQLPHFQEALDRRRSMAMNVLAITAYFLHPQYDNEKLSADDKKKINHFFLKHLDAKGLEELDNYVTKSFIFADLFAKSVTKPFVFWRLASHDAPNLAQLALKLLKIPASSAQLERLFSTWGFVHNCNRNRLSFDRSKKLSHLYYSYRLTQLKSEIDFDIDDEYN